MKKIYSIFAVAAMGGLLLVSCDNDSTNDVPTYGLEVTSAETSFPAAGGTKDIVVAKTPVSVYSNDSWATVTTSGGTISVTVARNENRESRHTTVVAKSSERDSAVVNIDQDGMIVGCLLTSVNPTDDAHTETYTLKHNLETTVTTTQDWLTASLDGNDLNVTYQANDTGDPRDAWIYYSSCGITDSIYVVQYEVDKDIVGNYEMFYYSRGWYYLNLQLYKKANGSYAMRFTDESWAELGFDIPVGINEGDEPGFYFTNLDSIGSYTYEDVPYIAMNMVMVDDGESVYYWSENDLTATAYWTVDDEGYSYYPCDVNVDYNFYGLMIGLSTNGAYSGFRSSGYHRVAQFPYAQFQKAAADDSEAKAAAAKPAVPGTALTGKTPRTLPKRLQWKAPQQLPVAPIYK